MAIKRSRRVSPARRTAITAGTSITAGVQSRQARRQQNRVMANYTGLTPQQRAFANQIRANCRKPVPVTASTKAIMGATNTSNIAARPDFLELLPLFTQKLLILDVFGSVAMQSVQQMIPYFKFIADNTKGETAANTILSSPMVNRQGIDPNFTGRVVKNEVVESAAGAFTTGNLAFIPVLPGSVTIETNLSGVTTAYLDDRNGSLITAAGVAVGSIQYDTGAITFTSAITLAAGDTVKATYQYDNETIGPDTNGHIGARMGGGHLQLDNINLIAEAHQLRSDWSAFAAFRANREYGASIDDIVKEAAFSQLTAEINSNGFNALATAASYKPQYNWDATPINQASVYSTDYLSMLKLKFNQASNSVYQETQLGRPNRIIAGTNASAYIGMIPGFQADSLEDTVGPYKFGRLDNYEVYVDPNYDPNAWVMCCKSSDIRKNSALFGEYMPLTETTPVALADGSIQQGYATMYAMEVVNPATVVSGKIVGVF